MGTATATGTKTTFKPDPQIFPQTKFSWDVLSRRLQELAFLNLVCGLSLLMLRVARRRNTIMRGVEEFVEWLNRSSDAIHPDVICLQGETEGVAWDIALQYDRRLYRKCTQLCK